MNKLNTKIIITLTAVSLFIIFTAAFTIQENCSKSRINEDPAINLLNLDLNDGLQDSENLSVYQIFQNFWTDVYALDAINWSYLDWRNYIILQIYGNSENDLNNTITNDPLFENNIDIFTIYVMGKYNNSLTDEEITNLKSQLIHNTVHIGDIQYLKNDDDQLKLYINIEVESSPSMWYVAEHLNIYLKSNNSNGKWYNASGNHYVKVYDISNLEFSDLIHTDGKSENYIVGPIIVNTNTIEENLSLIAKVEYFLNFLWDDYVEKLESFNLVDDDESAPEIVYKYTGNYTDGNPGVLIVNASDSSGLSLDPSGTYQVPNSIGNHYFTFTACDADNDRLGDSLNTTIIVWINITDDDILPPEITYIYTGNYTDGNPGVLIVNASDSSGLSLDPSGTYQVPNSIGNHYFTFTASDADVDRLGDFLNTTITIWINITDDDILPPEVTYIYTGNYTDGNPGQLIVNASDSSGLSLDPSGIYDVPNTLGIHEFTFIASDADGDRLGDYLNTTVTVWINITDDDDEGPLIIDVDIINNRVYDYYEFIIIDILVEDASGISDLFIEFNDTRYYDDDRDNQILIENTRILEIYNYFTVVAIDADNDREGDQKVSQLICSFEVFDDDSTPPEIHFYYEDFSYQLSIVDNDGRDDSKATGEFFLIDEQGIILQSGIILLENVNYTINIPLKPGNYCLEVYTTNNDLEFKGDEEYNNEIFWINVDLENCFQRVDKLFEDLIDYVDENLYFVIADNIKFKLCLARQDLMKAYLLVEAGDLDKCVFNELIIQAIIEFVEFETEFYNKIDLISTAIIDDMISFLHQIRNFVIILMGNSVDYVKGISCGYDIASIEVELLNLEDFIEEQLGDCSCKYLEHLIKLSSMQLELAIIKLSRDIDPDSALSLAKQFIDRAREETLNLLEENKISVDLSSKLLDSLNYCYTMIEEIDLNNN
jgi:hypothetical protein